MKVTLFLTITPQPIEINGRKGTIVYMDKEWNVVTHDKAAMAKVVFEDGSRAFFHISDAQERKQ
jgi:hypothetical protein